MSFRRRDGQSPSEDCMTLQHQEFLEFDAALLTNGQAESPPKIGQGLGLAIFIKVGRLPGTKGLTNRSIYCLAPAS
jgi:hypothetical protein